MNATQLPFGIEFQDIEGGIARILFPSMFYYVRSDFYGDATKFYCHAVPTLARAL